MGCDIHSIFQRKVVHDWEDIPHCFHDERDYFLFSWLANVRNGVGLAGGGFIAPIAERRGLPDDFQCTNYYHKTHIDNISPRRREYFEPAYLPKVNFFMGDHSYTWLFGSEVMAAYEAIKGKTSMHCGMVGREFYDKWDGVSPPLVYSSDAWGSKVVKNDGYLDCKVELPPSITHVRIKWNEPIDTNLDYYVKEVKRLMKYHGEIRHVMGFDS